MYRGKVSQLVQELRGDKDMKGFAKAAIEK
jgi:hypothetical protein